MQPVKLNREEIEQGCQGLNLWTLDTSQTSISKAWTFESFQAAIAFIVRVSDIAERHNHHPEFLSIYTKVQIRLQTHDVDGLTHRDFELAVAIDQLIHTDSGNLMLAKATTAGKIVS